MHRVQVALFNHINGLLNFGDFVLLFVCGCNTPKMYCVMLMNSMGYALKKAFKVQLYEHKRVYHFIERDLFVRSSFQVAINTSSERHQRPLSMLLLSNMLFVTKPPNCELKLNETCSIQRRLERLLTVEASINI